MDKVKLANEIIDNLKESFEEVFADELTIEDGEKLSFRSNRWKDREVKVYQRDGIIYLEFISKESYRKARFDINTFIEIWGEQGYNANEAIYRMKTSIADNITNHTLMMSF